MTLARLNLHSHRWEGHPAVSREPRIIRLLTVLGRFRRGG